MADNTTQENKGMEKEELVEATGNEQAFDLEAHLKDYCYDSKLYLLIREDLRYALNVRSVSEHGDTARVQTPITIEKKNEDGEWVLHETNPYVGSVKAKVEDGRMKMTIAKWKHYGVVPDFLKDRDNHVMVFDPTKL